MGSSNLGKAATLDELLSTCIRMFDRKGELSNNNLPRTFLLMHRWYLPSTELASKLLSLDANGENCSQIRLRICYFMRYWISEFPAEFNLDLGLVHLTEEFQELASQLGYEEHVHLIDISSIPSYDWMRRVTQRKKTSKKGKACLLFDHLEPIELAEHLTFLEHKSFRRISFTDYQSYVIRGCLENNPTLERSIALFNGVSKWVQLMILSKPTPQQRAEVITKFINVAQKLRHLQNFNTLMAVIGGLSHSSISRLKETHSHLSSEVTKDWNEMTELVSSNGNYCNYRKAFADCVGFKIPILGVHLKDLIAVHVIFPDWINENKVNIVKMQQLSVTLNELISLQTASHHLEPNMDLINMLMDKSEQQVAFQIFPHHWLCLLGLIGAANQQRLEGHKLFIYYEHWGTLWSKHELGLSTGNKREIWLDERKSTLQLHSRKNATGSAVKLHPGSRVCVVKFTSANHTELSLDLYHTEDDIYKLSLVLEPRTSKSPTSPTTPNKLVVPLEWASAVIPKPDPSIINKHIQKLVDSVFRNYDHDHDGYISQEDFESIAANFPFLDSFCVLDKDQDIPPCASICLLENNGDSLWFAQQQVRGYEGYMVRTFQTELAGRFWGLYAKRDGLISKGEMMAYFLRAKSQLQCKMGPGFIHNFQEMTYLKPTFCEHCAGFLWGIIKQGYKCKDCGANCHKQCRDLLVLACRKFARGTSLSSNHGSLPNSPSLPAVQDEVFNFPNVAPQSQELASRPIMLVTGSSQKISVHLQRVTTSQATQTEPLWHEPGWGDSGSHTFPKMKSKFHGKPGKNKGFAKWENEKSNIQSNMDIKTATTVHVFDQNGTEAHLERQEMEAS